MCSFYYLSPIYSGNFAYSKQMTFFNFKEAYITKKREENYKIKECPKRICIVLTKIKKNTLNPSQKAF